MEEKWRIKRSLQNADDYVEENKDSAYQRTT